MLRLVAMTCSARNFCRHGQPWMALTRMQSAHFTSWFCCNLTVRSGFSRLSLFICILSTGVNQLDGITLLKKFEFVRIYVIIKALWFVWYNCFSLWIAWWCLTCVNLRSVNSYWLSFFILMLSRIKSSLIFSNTFTRVKSNITII